MAKTFYNLNIYIKEIETLYVNTYEWKYFSNINSCNFFFSEVKEIKSCMFCVETANAGMGLLWFWLHLFILLFEETLLLTTKKFCKFVEFAIIIQCWPWILLIQNGKSVFVKKWIIVREKRFTVPILEYSDTVKHLLEGNLIQFRRFFQQHPTCQLQPKNFVLPIQWL